MARLRDATGRGKPEESGYTRILGNQDLGSLISRIHATTVSAGKELEKLIPELVANVVADLDKFIEGQISSSDVWLATKLVLKRSQTFKDITHLPDFLIFGWKDGQRHIFVVELKDGDNFDTKKSAAEQEVVQGFISQHKRNLPYPVTGHICCFNQSDKEQIVRGFKENIVLEEAMTGQEFCELLDLDYQDILKQRGDHAQENLQFFLEELAQIPAVQEFFSGRR